MKAIDEVSRSKNGKIKEFSFTIFLKRWHNLDNNKVKGDNAMPRYVKYCLCPNSYQLMFDRSNHLCDKKESKNKLYNKDGSNKVIYNNR